MTSPSGTSSRRRPMTHPRPTHDVPRVHRTATPTPRLHPPNLYSAIMCFPRRHEHVFSLKPGTLCLPWVPALPLIATRHCQRRGARSHGTKSREARPLPPDALLVRERSSSPGLVCRTSEACWAAVWTAWFRIGRWQTLSAFGTSARSGFCSPVQCRADRIKAAHPQIAGVRYRCRGTACLPCAT